MRPNELSTLFEYSWWATEHLFTTAEALTPEQFAAPIHFPFGSIRATLAHIMAAQWVWRHRFIKGESPTSLYDFNEFQSREELLGAFHIERDRWRPFLASATQEQLDAPISWKNTRGDAATKPLWLGLTHVVNHSTQHNSEIAQALTDFGHSPGNIDLIFWAIREGVE